jgi:hypothetical protein
MLGRSVFALLLVLFCARCALKGNVASAAGSPPPPPFKFSEFFAGYARNRQRCGNHYCIVESGILLILKPLPRSSTLITLVRFLLGQFESVEMLSFSCWFLQSQLGEAE